MIAVHSTVYLTVFTHKTRSFQQVTVTGLSASFNNKPLTIVNVYAPNTYQKPFYKTIMQNNSTLCHRPTHYLR